jgi:hypothetical protein
MDESKPMMTVLERGPALMHSRIMRSVIMSVLLAVTATSVAKDIENLPSTGKFQTWVSEMKQSPRGPFKRIRWFCRDGTTLPPKAYACTPHGGGAQHGEWTDQVKEMRADGYKIANVMAEYLFVPITEHKDHANTFKQIQIERYLVIADDGWILRRARFYRGAFQEQDERAGARQLLIDLSRQPWWVTRGFLALRTGARLLPHGIDTASVVKIRQLAASLSEKDPGFAKMRIKIHGSPGPEDAIQVRHYATSQADASLQMEFIDLADTIDRVYHPAPLSEHIETTADQVRDDELAGYLRSSAQSFAGLADVDKRFAATGRLLLELRDKLTIEKHQPDRLALLDLNLAVETRHLTDTIKLRQRINHASRRLRLTWLRSAVDGLYGTGLISAREYGALQTSFKRLQKDRVPLNVYKDNLEYLARVPHWASRWYMFHFSEAMDRLTEVEPKARLFIQDQLRGGGLLFYTFVLDSLLRDANRMAGIPHKLFGQDIGTGLHALNPGLARGVLHTGLDLDTTRDPDPDGIYLLPETVADLPPIAGILTAGEGNPLSHVQLLARNLGIPNVRVDKALIPDLEKFNGTRVQLSVSPGGSVHLSEDDSPYQPTEAQMPDEFLIEPDLEKLNLDHKEFLALDQLRAEDSGRIVGPKAAKLGELYHYYPDAVAQGLTIPFGAFRELLDQPIGPGGPSVFAWMADQYDRLGQMPKGSTQRKRETERFRSELKSWVENADPGDEFRRRLKTAMASVFGKDGSYGVFVRSDTNVEDLPGFSGAGLNLTVPNVVGFEKISEAIMRVWASPFTARAFAWRQGRMRQPEHVYPAVLLMRSVPSEKSGVAVTEDIETGDTQWISVSANEGVGGAVEGQAAESLRINMETGDTRLLASATAATRRILLATGGMAEEPVSNSERVIEPDEINTLIALSRDVAERFPGIKNADGETVPADIEFGFVEGQLRLFQIRPFLENKSAQANRILKQMDQGLKNLERIEVAMEETPVER